jgi:glycosyltransferase involved in cell wall biosynthesis
VRVLLIQDTWALVGGTERYSAAVVPGLLERGHAVSVLCREGGGEGLPEVPVATFPALAGASLAQAARAELAQLVQALAPDAIFVSALRNLDALALLADAAPLVRYVHDHTLFCPALNKVYETGETCRHALGFVCLKRYWLDGGCTSFKPGMHASLLDPVRELRRKLREIRITSRAARILTNSRYMRDQLVLAGLDPGRTAVLHPFTTSNSPAQPQGPLPPALERRLSSSGAPLLFTPARLTLPDKGVDFLITALAQVARPFQAVVCGEGPARAYLEQKAVSDGVADRTVFTGWLGSEAIETLYARADVVICPSVWDEPFGLVGIEAMAHSKPVIAFEVGGIPDWLSHGSTGLLVPRKDTQAMARAVERLLDDPARRRALGERGREVVAERFRREAHLDGLEQALRAAVESGVAGAGR